MRDRVPLYPGRVMLTPVPGQENTFDMVRADSPTQEGTQLNKANLLKDATAAMFGLGASAVPDEVLSFLGKYAQHWWKRRTLNAVLGEASRINGFLYTGNTVAGYAYYSDSYVINSDGAIELVNPTKITVGYSTYANFNSLKGKYFYTTSVYLPLTGKFWYMPSDAPNATRGNNSDTGEYYVKVTVSELSLVKGDFEYISESSDDVYPRLGYLNGYEYQYVGIPFDNAVESPVIEVIEYTGTGTNGISSKNTLSFSRKPKLVIITPRSATGGDNANFAVYIWGSKGMAGVPGNSNAVNLVSVEGLTMKWYTTYSSGGAAPGYQFNAASTVYTALAFL